MSEGRDISSSDRVLPRAAARDLEGAARWLPDDLEGYRNVVVVAFRRRQQTLVDSWVPWLEERVAQYPTVRFYEVPAIGLRWSPMRRFIDGGMATAIPDRSARRRTLTLYTDLRRLADSLGIGDRSTIWLFVVDRAGTVTWSGRGGYDDATAASLDEALARPAPAAGVGPSTVQFEFDFEARFRPLLALAGVTPSTAHVTVTSDRLVARFGPWSLSTDLSNVSCVRTTGPYRWYRAIGPRGSFADRGLTFGTNTRGGVCLEFRRPVHGLDPFGAMAHPGFTLTLARPEEFVALVRERSGT